VIVKFSEQAKTQLRELRRYIARQSGYPERATAYVKRIVGFCRTLDSFPERGTRCDDIFSGLRLIGFEGRVMIAFVVMETEVVIEGIFYGGQNIEAFYSDEDK